MLPNLLRFNTLDSIFNDSFYKRKENQIMKTDIKEKDGNYILDIDIPGYSKENIKLELEKGYLSVTAEVSSEDNNSEEKTNYLYQERYYGKSSRTFYIGESISQEEIKASFKNGILTVTFPKDSIKGDNKKYININD